MIYKKLDGGENEKDINEKNLLVLILAMPLFGLGHGILGLPTYFNWKWVVAGFGIGYLIYSYFNGTLLFGLIVLALVIIWLRNS